MTATVLKILGGALGSVVLYWSLAAVFVTCWLLAAFLAWAGNRVVTKVTGIPRSWSEGWFDAAGKWLGRLRSRHVSWIPGLLVQVWYAGSAAHLVRSAAAEASTGGAILAHTTGFAGLLLAAAAFHLLFSRVVQLELDVRASAVLFGLSLAAYLVLLGQPGVAALLRRSWARALEAGSVALIESL